MIDLAKPLGIHNNIVFYGDHEIPDLVYYFPDEIDLTERTDSNEGGGGGLYELFFQIFHEDSVTEGGIDELQKTAGSILQLGVQCKVSDSRLEEAVKSLKKHFPSLRDLKVTTPPWKDGSVNFMVLDSITSSSDTINEDSFVKSIISTNKPSLMADNLKSVFNIRFDRRGTALINSALEGSTGSIAGVLYDLKYSALRPAADLRISADLNRCQECVAHELGVKGSIVIYGIKLSIGAEFEWLTQKMEENGDIKIELLSQVDDAESKKQIDELVKDFKDNILKELFSPYVSLSTPAVPNVNKTDIIPEIGVAYMFRKEKIEHDRIIEVDYRERSTTVRTHTPQSHLWLFGKQIADKKEQYIKKIIYSDAWREQELKVDLINDFDDANNDLLSAEVIIWRKKYGTEKNSTSGTFAIPSHVAPLKNITFYRDYCEPVKFSWFYEQGEDIGYYYQIRFLYTGKLNDISSPKEILTEPISGSSQDLIIFPETYTFFKQIQIRQGNISFGEISDVDVSLNLKNSKGELLDVEIVTLNAQNKEKIWTIRGADKSGFFVETTKEYHFSDGRPSIKTQPFCLVDDEIIVNKPLSVSTLLAVVSGKDEGVEKIWLTITVNSSFLKESVTNSYLLVAPDFTIPSLEVPLNSEDDQISFHAKALMKDNSLVDIDSGQITSDLFIIDLNRLKQRTVVFTWSGESPEAMDLKYLKVELQSRETPEATPVPLPYIEFKGDRSPSPVTKYFDRSLIIEMRIVKKKLSGKTEQGEFKRIDVQQNMIDVSAM